MIYAKRKNALFGERLDVDVNNTIYDVVEDLVTEYKEAGAFEDFQLEVIRLFSINPSIDEVEFAQSKAGDLTENLFAQLITHYRAKADQVGKQTLPILTEVYETRGHQIENVAIPFTDGNRMIQVTAGLKKILDTQGAEVFHSFEKGIVLALIDEAWKEHLREMDDLKQSVQNAVYEQKDPVVIYKMEAFNLFRDMLAGMNKEVASFLFKGVIPSQQPGEVREARPAAKPADSRVRASRPELASQGAARQLAGMPEGMPMEDTREVQKTQPIRVEQRVGRNDPCPCGSGKKYKNCHG